MGPPVAVVKVGECERPISAELKGNALAELEFETEHVPGWYWLLSLPALDGLVVERESPHPCCEGNAFASVLDALEPRATEKKGEVSADRTGESKVSGQL